jgi:hypothetical protein
MSDTLITADSILKEWYWGDKVTPQMITATPLLSKIKSTKEGIVSDVGGRRVVSALRTAFGQGLGARAAGDPLPTARNQQFASINFGMKKMISRVEVLGEAWRSTEGAGPKAFIALLRGSINDALGSHAKELNGTLYRDATGLRTLVTVGAGPIAPAASANITVANAQYLTQGMLIDLYLAAVLVTNGSNVVVNSVDLETGIVNITNPNAGALTVAVGNGVYRAGNKDKEIMGLDGIIGDLSGLATLQGITVATNPFWRAKELDNGGVPRALTLDLMQQAFDASRAQTNENPNLLIGDFVQERKYANLLVAQRQFRQENTTLKLDGGRASLDFNGVGFMTDTDCQAGRLYFVNTNYIRTFQQTGYQWVTSPDAKFLWSRVAGFDSYEAVAIYEAEMAVTRRNTQAKLVDLITP